MKKPQSKLSLFFIIILGIFLWGTALRIVELINGNFLFGVDNGRDFLAAYNIVVNHKLTLIGSEAGSGVAGINGIFHGPGYFYLIALSYVLFHGDPIGAEIFMLIFGLVTLLVSAWVGYKMLGKLGAVLFMFFTAISPLVVSQSRFIWSVHPITVFVILALYFVYRIPDKPHFYVPLAVLAAGFTYNFQIGVAIPLTASILLSLPILFKIRDWKTYVYAFIALIFAFFPMLLFEMRHGFMAVRSALAYISSGGSGGSIFEAKRISSHAFDYWNNFYNTFTFEFGWIPWNIQMIMLYITMPVVFLGLFKVHEGKMKRFVWFLLFMIVFTCLAYLLLNNTVWDYYLTHNRFAYILLFIIAGIALLRSLKQSLVSKMGVVIGMIFIAVVFCGSIFRMYITYTLDLHDMGVYDKIYGKRLVIDTIYKDAAGKPFSVLVFMPSVYTYPYTYLFETYGKSKYGYVPKDDKVGLAYLVIEPDKNQPWRQKGWLETVVQGGKSIWVKTLLNGLILEKRIY